MKLLKNFVIFLSKLTKKTCPEKKKCAYYQCKMEEEPLLSYEEGKEEYCHGEYKRCARYYLSQIKTCDCVDELLEPQEFAKAEIIEKLSKREKLI